MWLAAIAVILAIATAIVVIRLSSDRAEQRPPAPPAVPPSSSRESTMKAEDVLAKLKPGMLRVDVESMLGPPTSVDSIMTLNGRLSYRATFNRNQLRPPLPPLVLEFDATQSGHPLLIMKPM